MALYNLSLDNDVLTIGFGDPGANTDIVSYVKTQLPNLGLVGGKLLKISGPASLPAAFTIASYVNNRYGAIAVFDPKLAGYVISVSTNPDYKVGDLIPA